ncbi:hypothetical protein M408DRAFT_30669 [Serendipita vermifera MAFF 305830]|uniref:Uncharacterized protein n=1 Tax=Serendipita vermifera MAFF 305830 TaxID=933852 RepID=A0A0C3AJ80_SERVB|nr:hypothetical protein M408DRAFT_30669 [Serendipita vermifera MAFF 305830]
MAAFARKAIAPGGTILNAETFNDKLDSDEVIFLLLHIGSDQRVLDAISAASQVLLGEPPIYASTSRALRMRARGMPKLELNGLATGHWSGEGLGVLWNQFSVVMKNPTRPFVVLVAIDPGSSSSESEDWPSASDDDDEEGAPAANALHPRLHFHPMQGSHFVD